MKRWLPPLLLLALLAAAGCSPGGARTLPSLPVAAAHAAPPPLDPVSPAPARPASASPAPPGPVTAPLTPQDRQELTLLGQHIWALAAAGDVAGLQRLIAPPDQLTAPGGEFLAEGYGPGLPNVVKWAQDRAAANLAVILPERQPYAAMDVIVMDTGRGHFAIFVTISDRRIVKLFGLTNFFTW